MRSNYMNMYKFCLEVHFRDIKVLLTYVWLLKKVEGKYNKKKIKIDLKTINYIDIVVETHFTYFSSFM